MSTLWTDRLADGARQMTSSAIRDLLKITARPEVISFAGGLPAPEVFPREELAAAAERAIAADPLAALQYGPTEGFRPLRELLAARMAGMGIRVPVEQVLITSGSQQALDLLGKLLIDRGTLVAVERPTYLGALQAWRPYGPTFLSLPMDDEGLEVTALEAALAGGARPSFLYLVSCFQNPTGVTLSEGRRRALVELAARYELPIVEDDPYGDLVYEGARPGTLAAIDVALHGELRNVVYLSTFSKTLAPGLRVGWAAAPADLTAKIAQAKQGLDLHTGSLAQATAYYACADGLLERQTPMLRATYGARRDAMLAALERHMPAGVRWTRPTGGMFVWLELPEGVSSRELLTAALERNVAFVPGSDFFAEGGGENTMRLNFSHPTAERIEAGVARLAEAMGR